MRIFELPNGAVLIVDHIVFVSAIDPDTQKYCIELLNGKFINTTVDEIPRDKLIRAMKP